MSKQMNQLSYNDNDGEGIMNDQDTCGVNENFSTTTASSCCYTGRRKQLHTRKRQRIASSSLSSSFCSIESSLTSLLSRRLFNAMKVTTSVTIIFYYFSMVHVLENVSNNNNNSVEAFTTKSTTTTRMPSISTSSVDKSSGRSSCSSSGTCFTIGCVQNSLLYCHNRQESHTRQRDGHRKRNFRQQKLQLLFGSSPSSFPSSPSPSPWSTSSSYLSTLNSSVVNSEVESRTTLSNTDTHIATASESEADKADSIVSETDTLSSLEYTKNYDNNSMSWLEFLENDKQELSSSLLGERSVLFFNDNINNDYSNNTDDFYNILWDDENTANATLFDTTEPTGSTTTKTDERLPAKKPLIIEKENTVLEIKNIPSSLPLMNTVNNNLTCRVVALSDGKIRYETIPEQLKVSSSKNIVQLLERIYYAKSHEQIKPLLRYSIQQRNTIKQYQQQQLQLQQTQQQTDFNSIQQQPIQLQQQMQHQPIQQQQPSHTYTTTQPASVYSVDDDKEQQVVSTVRTSLEDAGYTLLSKRDLALCDALNTGYLFRLSILPALSTLDASIGKEFYPELYSTSDDNNTSTSSDDDNSLLFDGKVLIYYRGYSQEVTKGRLIIPKLDYLQASLVDRSMNTIKVHVDRVERYFLYRSSFIYRNTVALITKTYRTVIHRMIPKSKNRSSMLQKIRTRLLRASYTTTTTSTSVAGKNNKTPYNPNRKKKTRGRSRRSLKLFETFSRYSSPGLFVACTSSSSSLRLSSLFTEAPNPTDPIREFSICEKQIAQIQSKYNVNGINIGSDNNNYCYNNEDCSLFLMNDDDGNNNILNGDTMDTKTSAGSLSPGINLNDVVDKDIYDLLNKRTLRCPYDNTYENRDKVLPPMQLLQRVSIGSLVDLFTKQGRNKLVETIVSHSKLVEPTYEEVIVVWRPKKQKKKLSWIEQVMNHIDTIRQIRPPKFVYDIADMFDIDGLPAIPADAKSSDGQRPPLPIPIEIRAFQDVPMANLKAVLPSTKLKLGPADALKFDLISIASFLAIVSSVQFDKPVLNVIALITIIVWIARTLYRYSNKLARYDLVVKTFLTSKISHRNVGAIEYLANEAASQRAYRASIVHYWLSTKLGMDSNNKDYIPSPDLLSNRPILVNNNNNKNINDDDDICRFELNALLNDIKETPININSALNDLIELDLLNVIDNTINNNNNSTTKYFKTTAMDTHHSTSTSRCNIMDTVTNGYHTSNTVTTPLLQLISNSNSNYNNNNNQHKEGYEKLKLIQYETDIVQTLKRKWDELFVVDSIV